MTAMYIPILLALSGSAALSAPVAFIEQTPSYPKLTRVLFFDLDGTFARVAGTVRQSRRVPAHLDMSRSYQIMCGMWRADAAGRVEVRQRVGESFGPFVPMAIRRWHVQSYTGAASEGNLGQTLLSDGVSYRRSIPHPLSNRGLSFVRSHCASVRQWPDD